MISIYNVLVKNAPIGKQYLCNMISIKYANRLIV